MKQTKTLVFHKIYVHEHPPEQDKRVLAVKRLTNFQAP